MATRPDPRYSAYHDRLASARAAAPAATPARRRPARVTRRPYRPDDTGAALVALGVLLAAAAALAAAGVL